MVGAISPRPTQVGRGFLAHKNMNNKKLIHCSFDIVDHFVPRVPTTTVRKEDKKIKRICVCSSVAKCLNAMPRAGQIIRFMDEIGMPIIVHAYYLESDSVHKPTLKELPDAHLTDELWILDIPKSCRRVDYEIIQYGTNSFHDRYGKEIVSISVPYLLRTKYTDNLETLANGCGIRKEDLEKTLKEPVFTSLASNADKDMRLQFRRKWLLTAKEKKEKDYGKLDTCQ